MKVKHLNLIAAVLIVLSLSNYAVLRILWTGIIIDFSLDLLMIIYYIISLVVVLALLLNIFFQFFAIRAIAFFICLLNLFISLYLLAAKQNVLGTMNDIWIKADEGSELQTRNSYESTNSCCGFSRVEDIARCEGINASCKDVANRFYKSTVYNIAGANLLPTIIMLVFVIYLFKKENELLQNENPQFFSTLNIYGLM